MHFFIQREMSSTPTLQNITNTLPSDHLQYLLNKKQFIGDYQKFKRVSKRFLKTPRWTVNKTMETFHKVASDPKFVLKREDMAFMRHLKGTNSLPPPEDFRDDILNTEESKVEILKALGAS